MSADVRVSCLLLAAGRSSRMQGANKLLIKIDNRSMLARTLQEIEMVSFQEVVVVTGHDRLNVLQELEAIPSRNLSAVGFKIAHNDNYVRGMHSSIRTGLEALMHAAMLFFICLSDQPTLHHETMQKLIQSYREKPSLLTSPTFKGERGHPVLIDSSLISEILAEADGDYGCAYLFKRYAEQTQFVEMSDNSVVLDIDSPQDLAAFNEAR